MKEMWAGGGRGGKCNSHIHRCEPALVAQHLRGSSRVRFESRRVSFMKRQVWRKDKHGRQPKQRLWSANAGKHHRFKRTGTVDTNVKMGAGIIEAPHTHTHSTP